MQIESIQDVCSSLGVRMTVDIGQRTGRIRLLGQTKDVYKADSRVKEELHKIKANIMEEQEAVMLAQFVRIVPFIFR